VDDEVWDDFAVRREGRRYRALVADDDEGIRRLLTAVLELDGWEVHIAGDGEEAVAVTERVHPDAVLLDVMMPNSDGFTALRRIRANAANRDVAIVMVSALGEGSARAEAAEAGADDYLVKPIAVSEVASRVLRLVQRSDSTSTE